jgi:hypothetical protein
MHLKAKGPVAVEEAKRECNVLAIILSFVAAFLLPGDDTPVIRVIEINHLTSYVYLNFRRRRHLARALAAK